MHYLTGMRQVQIEPGSGNDHLPRIGHFTLASRMLLGMLRRDSEVIPVSTLPRSLVERIPGWLHGFRSRCLATSTLIGGGSGLCRREAPVTLFHPLAHPGGLVETPGFDPQQLCRFNITCRVLQERRWAKSVCKIERRRIGDSPIQGESLLIAALCIGYPTGLSMQISKMPHRVRRQKRIPLFPAQGYRLPVQAEGTGALVQDTYDVRQCL